MQTINPIPVKRGNLMPALLKKNLVLATKTENKKKNFRFMIMPGFLFLFTCFFSGGLQSQTTIFSQDFSSSTSVASYISATPNSGQYNGIATAGTTTVAISGGALSFTRGNSIGSFTRSTDFSPTPTAIVYAFDINVSGLPGTNANSAAAFQVGSLFNPLTNNVEPAANTFAYLGIDFRGTTNFRFRDVTNGNFSANYLTGTTYRVTWALNNSGSSLTYTAPNGSSETIANDRADIWVGTTKIWNDVLVQTILGSLTDLKFAFTQSTGTISLDNFNIYSINPFITTQPSSVSICTGASASFTTAASGTLLSYQWKKDGVNLSNGGNISGATSATLTINPATVSDAGNITVDVTSLLGYTATSNNATFTVSPFPTITTSAAANDVCYNTSSQNSSLGYSATTGSPATYTITWNAAALAAGLVNLGSTALPASPITVPVAAGVAVGTYTGTLTVTNAGGCSSSGNPFTITVNPSPTITASATALARCFSPAYQNGVLTYSSTTNSPTHYTITWDAAAQAAGLTNVGSTVLAGSPISLPITAGTAANTYNATIAVSTALGCTSTGAAFTQEIIELPTITTAAAAATKCFSTSSQTATLSYSGTTNSPTLYSITWDAAALAAGLVNLGWTTIPASALNVPVAANVAAGTYTGSVRVLSGAGCQSASGVSFTLTIISAAAPVMTSASSASICSGATVNIPLTSDVPSTYTWIATDNADVTGESLTLQTTSTLNNTLTNSLTTARNVIYTVRPTALAGCEGSAQTVTVTVNPIPTITASATAASRCYNTNAQTSTLSYSATTASPATYRITWDAAAQTAGLVNTGNVTLPGSPIIFSVPAGVAAGTYNATLTVATASGCTSTSHAFTFTITAGPSITMQPSSTTVCAGATASFSITATGPGLTYQWRKGTTNICSCPNITGTTTPTLTINTVSAGDAASNYNCVVSSAGCSNVISNFATLTVTPNAVAPTGPAKDLVFPTVSTTSIVGSFTESSTATHYLVVRKTTNVAPTNPSDGTTYTVNSTALTGNVDYVGTNTSFSSNGLTPGTTYYFWVFPYNISSCGTSPRYFTTSPLMDSATTATNVSCGTITTLYWGGTGSALIGAVSGTDLNTASNWSTSSTIYIPSPVAPTECNNVSLALTSAATITLSSTTSVYGLTFTVSGIGINVRLSTQGNTLTVNGNATVDVLSGNNSTNIYIGENSAGAGVIDFKGNFKLGETNFASNVPRSYIIGNFNSKIIFRGDVMFGRSARFTLPGNVAYPPAMPTAVPGVGTTPGTIEFDGTGLQQVLWNNNVYYDCFYNIVVGNQNKPYVKHVTGTYTPDNILNNFTINDGCTVDLGSSQWIREASGGTFTMNGNAKLILGNNRSVVSSFGTGVVVAGSNFPGGFATMNISPSSTIEYNGGNSITQTVYATPTYGNLILSNVDGTGTANKISTGPVTVSTTAIISNKTTFTPGTSVIMDGVATVNNGGTWVCGTNVVSGAGTFSLASGGTLTMGSPDGITASGATGNIQTAAREFSTGGNYTYNGTVAQAAGSGLPTTMNNLSILNTAGVTMHPASQNYTVAGTLALSSSTLNINGDSLTINNLTRTSGTLTGSATSSVGITGTNVPLFFTSGGRTLRHLFLGTSASADLQTSLDITAGSNAGSVAVGSGSILNTYGNLTLKSDANGTARVAAIPVNGAGVALGNINGNITIERYIPGKRAWRMVTAPVQSTGNQTINDAWQEGVVNTDLTYNQNPSPGFGIHISGSDPALGFDVTPLNNPSLKIFDRATSNWVGVPNTLSTTVRAYQGYMMFVRGNRSTNLNLNTTAPLTNTVIRETDGIRMGRQSVTLGSGAGSYTLVGNPYPSTIDFRTLSIIGLGSTKTFVMWDPALTGTKGVGAYQYFTQSGGAGTDYTVFPGGGSYGAAGTVNNFVQSGQAFLVQNTGAATLTINESSKVASSTSTVFRPMPDNITGKISTILYGVEADSTTTVLDGGLVMYRSEYDDNIDLDDVKKMNNTNSENFGLNKTGNIFQVEKRQSISENDTIHYSMRNLRARTYQLVVELKNMEAAGITAYLKDNYTGTSTALDYTAPFKFTFTPTNAAPGSYAADRFKIYFKEVIVLPVTFTSIQAYRDKNMINVEWKVENESGIRHYEVERSVDGVSFTKTSNNVAATNSNTYQLVDENPIQGINYFRVKAVENNRRIKYTNIAKVFFGKNATGITVYPNPVTDGRLNVYITGEQKGDYHTNLFNANGQLVQTNKLGQLNGNVNTTVELNKDLPHGNYILEVVKPDLSKEHINIVY